MRVLLLAVFIGFVGFLVGYIIWGNSGTGWIPPESLFTGKLVEGENMIIKGYEKPNLPALNRGFKILLLGLSFTILGGWIGYLWRKRERENRNKLNYPLFMHEPYKFNKKKNSFRF